MIKRQFKRSHAVKILLAAFFIITVIFPLITMLLNIAGTDVKGIILSPQFKKALANSFVATSCATIISIVLAYIFALALVRTNMRFRQIFSVFVTLPMLIPSISHGMGLALLLGANGIITRLLHLHNSIYGFSGIVSGSVFYAFPVAFLMLYDILKYEDESPYEAARVLGVPKINQFFAITFPWLRKPLISVVFAVFTLIFTDYGVPLIIGGRFTTLPVLMYQEVIGLLHFGEGSVIGSFLLIPAIIAFLFDLFNKDSGSSAFVISKKIKTEHKMRDFFAFLYCILICFIIALPIFIFALLSFVNNYPYDITFSFSNIAKTMNMGAGIYLKNSVIIAFFVSLIGTTLSYITAYFSARMKEGGAVTTRLLHMVSITSLAIPGMVLGISYVLFFKGTFLYGTLAMLVLVNTVHFFASPYLMAYNSLGKLNANLEDVGLTLGVSRFHIIKDVLLPQTKWTIIEMASYFFVNCMMTISAVSFLSTVRNMPISLMITQFESQMFLEGAAFVSLLILICNFAIKTGIYFVRKKSGEE